jgi:predicted AAA+ superfamily ATPase
LLKQTTWSGAQVRVHHFRSQTGQEVDFVLEHANGGVVGVEVKATASLGANAMRGLKALGEAAGKRFKCGVVLYTGKHIVPFGEKLFAMPIAGLWA